MGTTVEGGDGDRRVLPGPAELPTDPTELNKFLALVADKAWEYLGLTGEEFQRRWCAGAYREDPRPSVQALDRLMRTGQWHVS